MEKLHMLSSSLSHSNTHMHMHAHNYTTHKHTFACAHSHSHTQTHTRTTSCTQLERTRKRRWSCEVLASLRKVSPVKKSCYQKKFLNLFRSFLIYFAAKKLLKREKIKLLDHLKATIKTFNDLIGLNLLYMYMSYLQSSLPQLQK